MPRFDVGVRMQPVEFVIDLALQISGIGADPHRAAIFLRPHAGRGDIAQGLADAGTSLGNHHVRCIGDGARGKGRRNRGGIISLLRARLGIVPDQFGQPRAGFGMSVTA